MFITLKAAPLTRVEGHLDIKVTVGTIGGEQQVVEAKSSGTMFRGFETILKDRDPNDAVHLTQRVCGVCPIAHGMTSALTLDAAYGVAPPNNGRVLRNLVLGANFIQSHILHFYHLALPDYLNTSGILNLSPWTPRYVTSDMLTGPPAQAFVDHYVEALRMRRVAHEMGAVFGGKLPSSPAFVAGGFTEQVAPGQIAAFQALLGELRDFIDTVFIPDVEALTDVFFTGDDVGRGPGNLLAYGVFDLATPGARLLARGRITDGAPHPVDPDQVTEYVRYSHYTPACGNLNPKDGVTVPQVGKSGAYSWIKAPRYLDKVHEVGPLARMWINGDYDRGVSVNDRLLARAREAKKIADAMVGWLLELVPGADAYTYAPTPASATAFGLSEAPRGAVGHWLDIRDGKIDRYQIVTPTAWNCSPKDDAGQRGPLEQALIGTPVAEVRQPIEVMRVVHSFDPCLACAVH